MAEETNEVKTILTIDVDTAAASLADLKDEVDAAKNAVAEAKDAVKAYQAQQELGVDVDNELRAANEQLQKSTAELKSAQSAYNESLAFTAKGIKAADGSFNALNARLGELKVAWKATGDATERARLTEQINAVKAEINGMNESIGNFQHNVGNYKSGFAGFEGILKGMSDRVKMVGDGMKVTAGNAEGLSAGLRALSTNPVMAMIGILVSLFVRLKDKIGDTEAGAKAFNNIMAAGKTVLEPVGKAIEWIGVQLGKVAEWMASKAPAISGFLLGIVPQVTALGNTILQALLTPIRTVIAAAKGVAKVIGDIFRGDWSKVREDARAAAEGIGDAFNKGFALKANYEQGKERGMAIAQRMGGEDVKAAATEAGQEVAQAYADGMATKLAEVTESDIWRERTLSPLEKWKEQLQKEIDATWQTALQSESADLAQLYADIDEMSAAAADTILEDNKKIVASEKAKVATFQATARAISGALSSVADMMEASADGTERNAEQVKAIRIASATIDTISGAVGAFASAAANPGGIVGMIIGAANAAAVTAAGIANIAKIKSTTIDKNNVNGNSLTGAAMISSAPQYVNAPAAPTYVPQPQEVRTATSASQEEALNKPLRAYIVSSDLEADAESRGRITAETSF